ncbi:MAG: CapA family protein [Spirochaetaceae bacterium]
MSATPASAVTPRELARLPCGKALFYGALLRLIEWSGVWRYPIRASGDYEEMRTRDILYWLHKAKHHIVHPERGSDLEACFANQQTLAWPLPERFTTNTALTISAVGDLMDHEYLSRSHGLYHHVAEEIFGADLPMAHLEAVVLDTPSESPRFDGKSAPRLRIDGATLDLLTDHEGSKYAFLSAACNHSLDFGAEGVRSTAEALRGRGIAFHGINGSAEEAQTAQLLVRRGITVALLSHTFGLNGWKAPADRPWIVNRTRLNYPLDRVDLSGMERQIAHARREGADFVIAQLHWGMEFEHYPRPQQIEVAHALAEKGVDAIFGHHPHVLQPYEQYRTRRDPDRLVPIFYSLGSLTNPFRDPRLCRSLLARVELAQGRCADGSTKTYVREARAEPIAQTMDTKPPRIELRKAAEESQKEGR